jgi:hypothetical protein
VLDVLERLFRNTLFPFCPLTRGNLRVRGSRAAIAHDLGLIRRRSVSIGITRRIRLIALK